MAKGVVTYDTKTKKKTVTTENISTKDVPEDKEITEKYAYVDKKSKEYSNEIVGEVTKKHLLKDLTL